MFFKERTENFSVLAGTVPSVLKMLGSHFDDKAILYRKQFYFISQPCISRLNLSWLIVLLYLWRCVLVLDADEVNRKGRRTTRQWRAYVSVLASSGVGTPPGCRPWLQSGSSLTSDFRNSTFHHIYIEIDEWQGKGRYVGWRKSRGVRGISIHCSVNAISVLGRRQNKYFPTE